MGPEYLFVYVLWSVGIAFALALVYVFVSKAKWLRRTLIAGSIFVGVSVAPMCAFFLYAYLSTMNDPQPTPEQLRPAKRAG